MTVPAPRVAPTAAEVAFNAVTGPDFFRYHAFKRRMYAVGSLAAVSILVLSWVIRDAGDVFVTFIYPVAAIAVTVFTLLMVRAVVPLIVYEWTVMAAMSLFVFARLVWLLYIDGPIADRFLTLAAGHYWALGMLIVAGFVLLSWRAAMTSGIVAIAGSAVLAAGAIPGLVTQAHPTAVVAAFIARIHVFLLLTLTLTSIVAVLREHLSEATTRAEVLATMAMTDPLTGLANRRAARSTLAERIAGGQAVGLITVDLDHFKTVNDTWGHERGDEALIAVAEVLRRTVRGDDVVARWGGEEFLIIASIAHGEAIELAERCRVAIESERPAGIALTATFGVAAHEPGDVVDVTLRRADELLYDAKRSGRNRVEADHGV